MKKFILQLLFFAFLFTNCKSPYSDKEDYMVCFYLQPRPEILPFSKAMPDIFHDEPQLEGPDKEKPEGVLFSCIAYAVFEKETKNFIRYLHITEDDEDIDDFGYYLYDTFSPGSYLIAILTHSDKSVINDDHLLEFHFMDDIFYGAKEIIVDATKNKEPVEIILKRKVSRVEFVAKDIVPEELHVFNMEVNGFFNQFNLLTGEAETETSNITFEYNFTDEQRAEDYINEHKFYTLVPVSLSKVEQVTLSVLDEEKQLIRSRKVNNIPIYQNRITRYTGKLYTSGMIDDSFELQFDQNGEWDDPDEHELD